MAFMGLPWPTNKVGKRGVGARRERAENSVKRGSQNKFYSGHHVKLQAEERHCGRE